MICVKCGATNNGWRAFCARCGHSLGEQCRCSFPNQPNDKYCGGCGQSLVGRELRSTSLGSFEYFIPQLSETQINMLIKDGLALRFSDQEIQQSDIDSLFKEA